MMVSNRSTSKTFSSGSSKWIRFIFLSICGLMLVVDVQPARVVGDPDGIWYAVRSEHASASKNPPKKSEHITSRRGSVRAGAGYSRDTQMVTEQQCFNVKESVKSEREGQFNLDRTVPISELETFLEIGGGGGGGVGKFVANSVGSYLKKFKESEYSISQNYLVSLSQKVTVTMSKTGIGGLNEFGQDIYKNNRSDFGKVCGDEYIAAYKIGAFLIAGIVVKFKSTEDKRKIDLSNHVNIQGMGQLFGLLKNEHVEKGILGSVLVDAYQLGGEPARLSKIVGSNGIQCNFSDLNECNKAAESLQKYAAEFLNSFENTSNGFEPLGAPETNPISNLGLEVPPSLVDENIRQLRHELSKMLIENEYYEEKLESIMERYPVPLDGNFKKKIEEALKKARKNVLSLKDPLTGAVKCYNDPLNCVTIKTNIDLNLQKFPDDFKLLKAIEYTVQDKHGATFYNTGGGHDTSWLLDPATNEEMLKIVFVSITDEDCTYELHKPKHQNYKFKGTWNAAKKKYEGEYTYTQPWLCYIPNSKCKDDENGPVFVSRSISPFFFEKYVHD